MTKPQIALVSCIGLLALVAYIKADQIYRQFNRGNVTAPRQATI